jgi:hypothetical protein
MSERENDGAGSPAKKTYYLVIAARFDNGHASAYVCKYNLVMKPTYASWRWEDEKADFFNMWFDTKEEAEAAAREFENGPPGVPQETR